MNTDRMNSEILKYVWQDFTARRTSTMAALVGAVVLLAILSGGGMFFGQGNWHNAIIVSAESLRWFSLLGYYVLIFLWGGFRAANAVSEEVKENTWDNQRLSAVTPWQLTVGKLFGSTLYPWFGGLLFLGVYYVTGLLTEPREVALFNVLVLLGTGLLCHTLALLLSLLPLRIQARRNNIHMAVYFIVALICATTVYFNGVDIADGMTGRYGYVKEVTWFGWVTKEPYFFIASLGCALFWTILCVYRFMREALQFKSTPRVWTAFVIFIMVYYAGLATEEFRLNSSNLGLFYFSGIPPLGAVVAGAASTYLALYAEQLNITHYRKLFRQWQLKNWAALRQLLPMWVVSYTLTLIAAVFLLGHFTFLYLNPAMLGEPLVLVASILLFLLRDAGVFHYFSLNPSGRLPAMATLLYLGILYLLLPGIWFALNAFNQVGELGFPFYPGGYGGKLMALVPVLLQVVLVALVVRRRYKTFNSPQ